MFIATQKFLPTYEKNLKSNRVSAAADEISVVRARRSWIIRFGKLHKGRGAIERPICRSDWVDHQFIISDAGSENKEASFPPVSSPDGREAKHVEIVHGREERLDREMINPTRLSDS